MNTYTNNHPVEERYTYEYDQMKKKKTRPEQIFWLALSVKCGFGRNKKPGDKNENL